MPLHSPLTPRLPAVSPCALHFLLAKRANWVGMQGKLEQWGVNTARHRTGRCPAFLLSQLR